MPTETCPRCGAETSGTEHLVEGASIRRFICDPRLTHRELRVVAYIWGGVNGYEAGVLAYPTISGAGRHLRIDRRDMKKIIADLERKGMLSRRYVSKNKVAFDFPEVALQREDMLCMDCLNEEAEQRAA